MTSSPVLAPWLLGLTGRGVFCHRGFALEHLPDSLHPWEGEVRALSVLMAGRLGRTKLRLLGPRVGPEKGGRQEGCS